MALDQSALEQAILDALNANGIDVANDHCAIRKLANAVSTAVVAGIQSKATVTVTGGSSAGTYSVE